jgi:serine/threonine-protein kinase
MTIRQKKLPIAALERIDDICAEFERQWQANDPPSIESAISADVSGLEKDVLLAELIVLDVDYRRRKGEKPARQDYLDRFPNDAKAIDEALNEGQKSARPFEPPTVEELSELFPTLQIETLIGAGGMGAVYRARQKGLDRLVALKILPREFGHDVKFALRFTREARTLAKLSHPNIVSVFEFGNVEDTYYFLMEYVDGSTLRDVVSTRQLSPEHALTIVPHLCDALQYAHDKGVIHRDIKPENILMGIDGSVKIADFGLSRILDNDGQPTALTATHQVMGTPRYMAPEQLEGARGVDHRADIYSLGVVFYEMLTGELPIGRFAAPSQKVSIDVRLDEVVLRTLEKEPQRRYQHASQIKSDVQTLTSSDNPALAHTVISDKPPRPATTATTNTTSLEQQELASRLLLTRRQLMENIQHSLRPLFRGQIIQMLCGIALIALGAQCWARHTNMLHRVICGAIVHVYGVVFIGCAAAVCTRIKRIDYSKPVREIRTGLDTVQSVYLKVGMAIGFPWWLMWIPVTVAVGFDGVLYPGSLIPSLIIGIVGLAVSLYFYARLLSSKNESAPKWRARFSGESIRSAYLALEEIEAAQIQ